MFYKSNNSTTPHSSFAATNRTKPQTRTPHTAYETRRPKESSMIFGTRAVIEAIEAGKTLDKILIRRDMSSAIGRELMQKLEGLTVPIQRVPVEKLNQYTDKNHQGVIAFLSPIEFHRIEDIVPSLYEEGKTPLLVVLDGITDVRNFGAIARTCVCAGADAIIIGARSGVAINGDAVKTSAGALHSIPVCKVDNLQNALTYLRESGISLVAATEHTETGYTEADMTAPIAIVLGSEEHGIYEENLKLCDTKVRIPMTGVIESLNVSVAAGIMIYEAIRQRA